MKVIDKCLEVRWIAEACQCAQSGRALASRRALIEILKKVRRLSKQGHRPCGSSEVKTDIGSLSGTC